MTVEEYGVAAGPVWRWTGRSQVPIPFTVNASFDVVGDAVHLVSGPAFRVRVLDDPLRPDLLPAYDRVLAAAGGRVWAQVHVSDPDAPHVWDVFDPTGRFVGRVEVPGAFYPMVVGPDEVAGVWRDSVGVEYVRAYRLLRS